jgi:predicted dehydrogenase/threonine dehydrogenase-like Zn-dependent dehydrogenase
MKQVLQNIKTGITEICENPMPQVQPKMALVKTAVSLVSAGTERMLVDFAQKNILEKARSRPDLAKQVLDKAKREGLVPTFKAAFNRLDQPMALGYSSAGTIQACGEGLIGFKPGDRVACSGGGHAVHAEYAVIPQNLMAQLPDEVDFESGAFSTLGAIALNGIRLANVQLGDKVAVIGLGLLGLITAKLAAAAGCAVFGTDINIERVRWAKKIGFTAAARSEVEKIARSYTCGRGFDAVLICADTPSSDTVLLAGEIARDRGHVISLGVVGLDLPRKPYYEKELFFQVSRSSGPGRYDNRYEKEGIDYPLGYVRYTEGRNLEAFVQLLAVGKLDVKDLITHRYSIENAGGAYSLITGKKSGTFLGVLITYPPGDAGKKTRITIESQPHASIQDVVVGVLGAGNYANAVFLPTIAKAGGSQLKTIVSATGTSAAFSARKFHFQYASSDENEIYGDKAINSVVILSQHDQHARQVIQALHKNKNVYCEKPLAIHEEELAAVEKELGRKNHPLLMVGFNRRFAPFGYLLKDFISGRSEPLHAHYRVNAGALPLSHWQHDLTKGGGRIVGEGCHFIDFISFLVGDAPVSVWSKALPDQGNFQQDNVQIICEFKDGSIGSIAYLANGDKSHPKEYLEVFSGGRIGILNDFQHLMLVNSGKRKEYRTRLSQDKGHRAAWQAFMDSLRQSETPPPIPYDQILGVSRATLAARASLNTGQKVVIQ